MKSIQSPALMAFSHLSHLRRTPTDYEIVTSHLLGDFCLRFSSDTPRGRWYARYTRGSALQMRDWERFDDPEGLTYSAFVESRAARQQLIDGLHTELERTRADQQMDTASLERLTRAVYPLRYAIHALEMHAAYLGHFAPSGKVAVASLFQAADELARIECIARRMHWASQLHPALESDCRARWQSDPGWQPLRRLLEELLVCYDWGEAFVALNSCIKPLFDPLIMTRLPATDGLRSLSALCFALDADCRWHRRHGAALVRAALMDRPENTGVVEVWIDRWLPRTVAALRTYLDSLGEGALIFSAWDEAVAHFAECGLRVPELERIPASR